MVGDSRLSDYSIVAVSKGLPRELVQLPLEVRERLDLRPGTKLIVVATENAVVLQKAEVLLSRETSRGIVQRLRSIFSIESFVPSQKNFKKTQRERGRMSVEVSSARE